MAESKYFKSNQRLDQTFFDNHSTKDLARKLLGQILCRRIESSDVILKGKIVETEAYLGSEDAASHSFKGKVTDRNEPMFMKSGTAYVYFTYGMYHCFNISSRDSGGAVLIRSLEPMKGEETMISNRTAACHSRKRILKQKELCDGPGKLCIAFDIRKDNLNKEDVTKSDKIWIESGDVHITPDEVNVSSRIGIGKSAGEWVDADLRFFLRDSPFVSRSHPKRCKADSGHVIQRKKRLSA